MCSLYLCSLAEWGYPHWRFTRSHGLMIWLREKRPWEQSAKVATTMQCALMGFAIQGRVRFSPLLIWERRVLCWINRNHIVRLPSLSERPCYFLSSSWNTNSHQVTSPRPVCGGEQKYCSVTTTLAKSQSTPRSPAETGKTAQAQAKQ